MFRQLAVFLCLVGILSASYVHEASHLYNVPTQSSVVYSTHAPQQIVSSAQSYYDIPFEARILQSHLAGNAQPVSYTIQNKKQENNNQGKLTSVHAYVAKPSVTYTINPAVVKAIPGPVAVPVADKKVTVEAHQHVTAHPPTATQLNRHPVPVPVQQVYHHIKTVANRPTVQYVQPAVQVSSKTVHESVTAHPPAAYVSSTLPTQQIHHVQTVAHRPSVQYVSAPATYGVHSEVVKTVSAVPAPEEKVTIEAHQSVTAHPPTATYVTSPPVAVYPVYNRIQTVVTRPEVQLHSGSVSHSVNPSIQVGSKTGHKSVKVYPAPAAYITSTVAPYPIQYVKTIVNRPAVQYVSSPVTQVKPVYVKKPEASDTVTIEAHQSVTSHPPTSTVAPVHLVQTVVTPPSVQYVSSPVAPTVATHEGLSITQHGASHVHYSQTPVVSKPIPVPVIYSAAEGPRFVELTKHVQATPGIVAYQTPVAYSQPIPVPVAYPKSEAHIRYNHEGYTPLVYTKSIVEKDHASADLVATHVRPGYAGYSRAVTYSPASAVSSVSFNGLGVSYGW